MNGSRGLPRLPLSESQIPVEQREIYRKFVEMENIPVTCIDTGDRWQDQKLSGAVELNRSGGGGLVMLAGLLTMADNDHIHYADLFDPNKYVQEKKAAGQKLIDALSQIDRKPDLLAEVMAGCAKKFSKFNLKEATEAGEFREVGAPEHLHRNGEPGARAPKTNGTPKKG